MDGKSRNIAEENLSRLRELFPEAVKDGKVDIELLKGLLGESIQSDRDRYGLSWVGKSEAFEEIQRQTTATLVPDKEGSVDFNTTENLFIEGDNLEVLRVLQRSYYGKVKMIYIDPPYNTGNDFIYNDKFAQNRKEHLKKIGAIDDDGNVINAELYRKNVKDNGHFHSKWLSMMYPRLFLARNLLREDGVIFVSIDDNEVANLKLLMDMVFGEESFICDFIWQKKKGGGNDAKFIAKEHEYVFLYSKHKESLERFHISYSEEYLDRYKEEDEKGKYYWDTFRRKSGKQHYSIECPDGTIIDKDEDGQIASWLRSEKRFLKDKIEGEIKFVKTNNGWSVLFKQRLPKGKKPRSLLLANGTNSDGSSEVLSLFQKDVFSAPKPIELIKTLIETDTNEDDIILDFFAGSSTTAHAVLEKNKEDGGNRKFIMVQLPEYLNPNEPKQKSGYDLCTELGVSTNIAEISKERIRRAIKKIKEEMKGSFEFNDLDLGFKSFKLQESNFKIWNGNISEEEINKQLDAFIDITKPTATIDGMLYELILKSGLSLTATIEQVETAFIVEGKYAFVLSETTDEQFKTLLSKDLYRITVLEQALGSDDNRITSNQLLFEDKKIEFQII